MIADQMALWAYTWEDHEINKYFFEFMNIDDSDCTDLSTYEEATGRQGPANSDGFRASKVGMVEYFNMTLDLDYTLFVKFPTTTPTETPTISPSLSPTRTPTRTPTETPT
eukprot:CAMPEP_0114690738 /NCGR_PEP_ID=MMETSP0191-20121206/66026_1 /TAXON_ID=126664 /ORGANISM="Sorites sp." /LENGTH=109 /DNA_ID=CAMNT_0001981017 /DNA_START=401 /DNA_END=727 /DNA_ORIENTATION=-